MCRGWEDSGESDYRSGGGPEFLRKKCVGRTFSLEGDKGEHWLTIQFDTELTWQFITPRDCQSIISKNGGAGKDVKVLLRSSLSIATVCLEKQNHACLWLLTPKAPRGSSQPTTQEVKVTQKFSHRRCTRSGDNWQSQLESESVNRFLFFPPSGSP